MIVVVVVPVAAAVAVMTVLLIHQNCQFVSNWIR